MDKLNKNRFLAAMGALFIVAAAGFLILVLPAWGDVSKKNVSIKKDVTKHNGELADLPGDPNVKEWQGHSVDFKKRYADTLQKMLVLDGNLSQWFQGLDDNTTYAVFMNMYDDEQKKLQDDLADKGVLLGSPHLVDNKPVESKLPGFNWIQRADITKATTTEDERRAKEILQKRFNICRAIVNAVTANAEKGKGRQRRLLDVTFLEKFPYVATAGGLTTEVKAVYTIPIDYKRYPGYSDRGSVTFTELDLPSNGDVPPPTPEREATAGRTSEAPAAPTPPKPEPHLGKTLTFGFAVVMEYSQLPELIHNLIDPAGVQPELNLSIVGLNVFVPEPNPAEKQETVSIQEGEDQEPTKQRFLKMTADCPPPLVHVYVTCQVFDLDPAAVPAFLR